MPTSSTCPRCGGALELLANAGGSSSRCPSCGPAAPASSGPAGAPESSVPSTILSTRRPPDAPTAPTLLATPVAPGVSDATTAPTAPTPVAEGKPFGRYRLLARLGEGGMGVVWRALDTDLGRTVALKLILRERFADAEIVDRFLREARLAARLHHPNIVGVHDVGEVEGARYITMDFVDGETFAAVLSRSREAKRRGGPEGLGALRTEIAWLADVAAAVAYAHAQGVLHRDLKPANVLVSREGRAFVMDFGLAKQVSEEAEGAVPERLRTLTRTGQILGTPAYMSPEQADGGEAGCDPRSDVWSLGVLLYELLTGELPFEGATALALLGAVLQKDPVRPGARNPNLVRGAGELEAVCLRALEKEPSRRYATAGELAADLRRWLAGEGVRARPWTPAYRAWRWAARRWKAGLPIATAAAVAVTLGVQAWWAQARRAEEVRAAVEEGDRLEREGKIREARDAYARARALSEGSVEAGRGFARTEAAASRLDREAQERTEAAEKKAADARGVLEKADLVSRVLGRWVRLLEPLRRIERHVCDARQAPEDPRAIEESWPAFAAFLGETPEDGASRATARALAGWARCLTGVREEGLAWMREAASTDPDVPYGPLMEALLLLRDELLEQRLPSVTTGATGVDFGPPGPETPKRVEARRRIDGLLARAAEARVWGKGEVEGFRNVLAGMRGRQAAEYAAAENAFSLALDAPALLPFAVDLHLARGTARYLQKRFAEAAEDLDAVAKLLPGASPVFELLGQIGYARAEDEAWRGQDPREALRRALADMARALALDSSSGHAHLLRSRVEQSLGEAEEARGGDPRDAYRQALESLQEALVRDPKAAGLVGDRGVAWLHLAREEAARGGKVEEGFRKAVTDLEEAVAADPSASCHFVNLAQALRSLGHQEDALGADPRETYRKGVHAAGRAIELAPARSEGYTARACLSADLANVELERGSEPGAALRSAFGDFEAALSRNDTDVEAWTGLGRCWLAAADAREARDEETGECCEKARAAFGEAIRRKPGEAASYVGRGMSWVAVARQTARAGKDPGAGWKNAIADFDRAVERNAVLLQARIERASAWLLVAAWEGDHGEDARPSYRKALVDFDAAVARNPRDGPSRFGRAAARLRLAELELAAGGDARASFRAAVEDLDEAARLDAHASEPLVLLGRALRGQAEAQSAAGEDAKKTLTAALGAYERALERAPREWASWASKGRVLEALGRPAEAAEAYRAALRLEAEPPLPVRDWLAGAERAADEHGKQPH
ncbi:MAG: protein kinase [Planctomycetes bacterium]|nr:protein kinase [Planctomycetota bacterium]